jgi:hypothetical protein
VENVGAISREEPNSHERFQFKYRKTATDYKNLPINNFKGIFIENVIKERLPSKKYAKILKSSSPCT